MIGGPETLRLQVEVAIEEIEAIAGHLDWRERQAALEEVERQLAGELAHVRRIIEAAESQVAGGAS